MPTLTALEVICLHSAENGVPQPIIDQIRHNRDCAIAMLELSREYGITLLCGTDSGNSPIMQYGQYHGLEMDLLMEHADLFPQEAIKAATSDNALTFGLEGKLGALAPDYMADLIVLKACELTQPMPFRYGHREAS